MLDIVTTRPNEPTEHRLPSASEVRTVYYSCMPLVAATGVQLQEHAHSIILAETMIKII